MPALPPAAQRFTLTTDAAPGTLARVLAPFAKRDVVPDAMEARRTGDAHVVIVTCLDVDPTDAKLIRGDLLRLVGLRDLNVECGAPRLAA